MHLVGFIIRINHDARPPDCQIRFSRACFNDETGKDHKRHDLLAENDSGFGTVQVTYTRVTSLWIQST